MIKVHHNRGDPQEGYSRDNLGRSPPEGRHKFMGTTYQFHKGEPKGSFSRERILGKSVVCTHLGVNHEAGGEIWLCCGSSGEERQRVQKKKKKSVQYRGIQKLWGKAEVLVSTVAKKKRIGH